MKIVTADLETYWSVTHSLTKMSPIAYCMDERTEIISCAIKVDGEESQVYFGEDDVRNAFNQIDLSDAILVAHNNSGFDAMIFAWRFNLKPKMWGCTKAMAQPIHTKTTGNSLAKLVEFYGLGVKDNTALLNTKGKNLKDFTEEERDGMRVYNKADTDQCYALFLKLVRYYVPSELWHIDATIRMLVEPGLMVDKSLLEAALQAERDQKRKTILILARHMVRKEAGADDIREAATLEELEEAVRSALASSAKFAAFLTSVGVVPPRKPSPTNPAKETWALAKTDEAFIALQTHENEMVSAAARARLSVKSTLLETRIQAFLDASNAVNGRFPVPLNYCGADTTGRWSGWGYNPQNMPRIDPSKPKISDALRNCLTAPSGYKVVVADQSGIELRVNHFLWKVAESIKLYSADRKADLYRAFAAARYGIEPEEVTKAQRQLAKVAQLGLGFGAGWRTFQKVAKLMGGLDLTEEEAQSVTTAWRQQYSNIADGWRTCHDALQLIYDGVCATIDPWGLCSTSKEGIILPSGRVIRYPGLHLEDNEDGKSEWWYGQGRHRARIYAGKITENMVQALARDTIADNSLELYKRTGFYPKLMVHDELVYVVPESEAVGVLAELQSIMRTPPVWWPELVTESEGDIADTYGSAK